MAPPALAPWTSGAALGRCQELCKQLELRQLEAAARCRSRAEPWSLSAGEERRWQGGRKGRKGEEWKENESLGREGDEQRPDGLREGAGGSRGGRSAAGGRAMLQLLLVLLLVKRNEE